jgi:hypothetical protein
MRRSRVSLSAAAASFGPICRVFVLRLLPHHAEQSLSTRGIEAHYGDGKCREFGSEES